MKILAIGDFHGHVSNKLKLRVKKVLPEIDLILSPGDYSGSKEYSKIFFKKVYGKKGQSMEEILGKKKFNEIMWGILESGVHSIKWLSSLKKPVLGITGNWDYSKYNEIGWRVKENVFKNKYDYIHFSNKFYNKLKRFKNFNLIDMSKAKFENLNVIGHTKSSYPGAYNSINKKKFTEKYGLKEFNRIRNGMRKDYVAREKILNRLFKNENNAIFLGHNSPYGVLDIISQKGHKLAKGEHYGDCLVRQIILKHKPRVYICGHMHEHQGKAKLGKTLIINTGSSHEGKFAVIDYGKKINVKFVK